VELQGFEPWSKQAAKLLSTCLSFNWDFSLGPGKGGPIRNLSFFGFRAGTKALPALSCILMMLQNGTLTGGASRETAYS
jgi:hypothetical protein